MAKKTTRKRLTQRQFENKIRLWSLLVPILVCLISSVTALLGAHLARSFESTPQASMSLARLQRADAPSSPLSQPTDPASQPPLDIPDDPQEVQKAEPGEIDVGDLEQLTTLIIKQNRLSPTGFLLKGALERIDPITYDFYLTSSSLTADYAGVDYPWPVLEILRVLDSDVDGDSDLLVWKISPPEKSRRDRARALVKIAFVVLLIIIPVSVGIELFARSFIRRRIESHYTVGEPG